MADRLEESLKHAVAALDDAGVPHVLGGGMGCWARGGPPSSKDIDLMVKPEDAERALAALGDAGMRIERPPEKWLHKAFDGDVMIDLIFEPSGLAVDDEALARGELIEVAAMEVRVMALEDILVTKLCAIDEHTADFSSVLQIARALREQIDWGSLRARTERSPFARAFFAMAEGLRIAPDSA
jgi:predicted nucleotidyltransferase